MKSSWHFGITFVLLSSTFALSAANARRASKPLAHPLSAIAERIGNWTGTDDAPLPDRIVASLASTSYLSRTYSNGSRRASLFVAFYANQRAGESMHSPKYCMPGGGWELLDAGRTAVGSGGHAKEVNNYTLYKAGERMRMIYWYQGPYRVVSSEYKAKLYLLWDAARSGQTAGSIVRITTPDGPEAVRDALDFAADVIPQVERCFGPAN